MGNSSSSTRYNRVQNIEEAHDSTGNQHDQETQLAANGDYVAADSDPNQRNQAQLGQFLDACRPQDFSTSDIAKVLIGIISAIASGKVYIKPSKEFANNLVSQHNDFGRYTAQGVFITGTVLTNVTLNFFYILRLFDRLTKKSVAQGQGYTLAKTNVLRTLVTALMATLPASSMALLDFAGSDEMPEWERGMFFLVNLLIYGGLNLSGADSLVKSFWPSDRRANFTIQQAGVRLLEARYNALYKIIKAGSNEALMESLAQANGIAMLELFKNNNDIIAQSKKVNSSAYFDNLQKYIFKPLAILSLSGYFWITMVGMELFMDEEMGLSDTFATSVSPFIAFFAVYVVYGALMAQVVGEVANTLRDKYLERTLDQATVRAMLPYALGQQAKAFMPVLSLMMMFGLFSFATSVKLQISANEAFYEWIHLERFNSAFDSGLRAIGWGFTVLVGIITVLFNNYCTPIVVNSLAALSDRNNELQKKLDTLSNFIDEFKQLDAEVARVLLCTLVGISPELGESADTDITPLIEKLNMDINKNAKLFVFDLLNIQSLDLGNQETRSKLLEFFAKPAAQTPEHTTSCSDCVSTLFNRTRRSIKYAVQGSRVAPEHHDLINPLIEPEDQASSANSQNP